MTNVIFIMDQCFIIRLNLELTTIWNNLILTFIFLNEIYIKMICTFCHLFLPLVQYTRGNFRGYFQLKLSPTSGRCPQWLIFLKKLFYQNTCKEAMNIGGGQIRGALFNFFCSEKVPIFVNFACSLQFLK